MYDFGWAMAPEAIPAQRRRSQAPLSGAVALQRKIGNKAMGRLLATPASPEAEPAARSALKVGDRDDALEREADRAAEQVLNAATPAPIALTAGPAKVGRKCAACEEEEKTRILQRRAVSASAPGQRRAPASVDAVLGRAGKPLEGATRAFFETRFGRDFSGVRVHADAQADASARQLDALAYTVGESVVFARGRYDPHGAEGRSLLAHELAHVVQQTGGVSAGTIQRKPDGKKSAPGKNYGRVLFVQVDRSANTIAFVTESGTLVYPLLEPTTIKSGGYKFDVKVSGNNLDLKAPAEADSHSSFKYRIAADKPNPASLLRGVKSVDVIVSEDAADSSASATSGAETREIPVTFVATPLDEPSQGFGGGPGWPGVSGLGVGAGLGAHNLAFNDLSWLDSPLSRTYWDALLPRSGIPLDRTLDVLPRDLTPRLQSYLELRKPGSPLTYINQGGRPVPFKPDPASTATRAFSAEELLSIESLTRRYVANPSSLNPAELQLLREAARIHISGSTPTAPFASYSKPGTLVPWSSNRRYVVRVQVDRGAALDVSEANAFNLDAEAIKNVEEAEFLVVGDQSGRIISVQSVKSGGAGETSWALRNAGKIRWGGRILLIAGLAYSGYRIATASKEERPRVIGEEAGGLFGGLAGGAAATAGCVAFAIATEGLGLFLCGMAGGVLGGGVGAAVGGATPGFINDWAEEAYRRSVEAQGDPIPSAAADFWLGPALF
jgi:hypothetical protein